MNIDAKVGGGLAANDHRDVQNWTGDLRLRATTEGDPFWIAAIYRLLRGNVPEAAEDAMKEVAKQCLRDHNAACKAAKENQRA